MIKKNEGIWMFNIDGDFNWNGKEYDSLEECKKEGIIEALEHGYPTFEVGLKKSMKRFKINAHGIIDDLKDKMKCMSSDGMGDKYLSDISDEQIKELEVSFNRIFSKWLDKHNIDGGEGYYNIENIKVIKYCANCRKEIKENEECSELIEIVDDYEREHYFHDRCSKIPFDHLIEKWKNELANI